MQKGILERGGIPTGVVRVELSPAEASIFPQFRIQAEEGSPTTLYLRQGVEAHDQLLSTIEGTLAAAPGGLVIRQFTIDQPPFPPPVMTRGETF